MDSNAPDQGKEVTVVGAGPSGLTAAINLAQRGYKVHVRERRPGPGMRHHGFQGLENWSADRDAEIELRTLGIEPDFLLRAVRNVTYFGPSGSPHDVTSPEPLFYLVRRGSEERCLDRSLAEQATQLGVKISYNDKVDCAPKGSVVGIGPTGASAIAKGTVFKTDSPDVAACIVDEAIAPKAYAYLLVHGGSGTLAVMLTQEFNRADACLHAAAKRFQDEMSFAIREATEFGGAGNVVPDAPRLMGGHLRVGECAGAQDALWGFGLWLAMRSGALAARCLDEGLDYENEFRSQILPKVNRLVVSRWLFDRIPGEAYDQEVARFGRATDARLLIKRHYGSSAFLRLLLPFARRKYAFSSNEARCHSEDCDCTWCRHGRYEQSDPSRRHEATE